MESGLIEEYVQLGLCRNPRIQEAQHKVESIRHKIPQVLSLPDPMVNTTTHLAPVQTAAGEQAFALGVSQKITNVDRRATQASIVCEEVAAAKANLETVELEVAEQIRKAGWQLVLVRKSIEITKEDQGSLANIAESIEAQFGAGKKEINQQDVLNIQVEQSKIDNQVTELLQKEQGFQARLARLLHLDPQSDLQVLDQLQVNSGSFDVDALIAQAIEARPDLRAQIANVRRDCKKIHLACLKNKPDFTVGLNWIATSTVGISPVANGDDAVLLGVGFNLPIYKDRIRAAVCEAKASKRASESRLESLQDQAAEEVFDIIQQIDSAQQTLSLIQEDIIPKSQRTLNLSFDEYSTGKIDYVQLIENWRSVLRYRLLEANLLSQYQQLMASLARSVGQIAPLLNEETAFESTTQPGFERYQSGLIKNVTLSPDSGNEK